MTGFVAGVHILVPLLNPDDVFSLASQLVLGPELELEWMQGFRSHFLRLHNHNQSSLENNTDIMDAFFCGGE